MNYTYQNIDKQDCIHRKKRKRNSGWAKEGKTLPTGQLKEYVSSL